MWRKYDYKIRRICLLLLTLANDRSPSRPLGEAELLVEASFMDMRHGGDGNLSRAYELAKKVRPMLNAWY